MMWSIELMQYSSAHSLSLSLFDWIINYSNDYSCSSLFSLLFTVFSHLNNGYHQVEFWPTTGRVSLSLSLSGGIWHVKRVLLSMTFRMKIVDASRHNILKLQDAPSFKGREEGSERR